MPKNPRGLGAGPPDQEKTPFLMANHLKETRREEAWAQTSAMLRIIPLGDRRLYAILDGKTW